MNSSVSIRCHRDGNIQMTTIIDDKKIVHEKLITTWDMNEIRIPKERFRLSSDCHKLFVQAINSDRGRDILQKLKNRKTEQLINRFLEGYRKGLGKRSSCALVKFVDEVIKQPLVGSNQLSTTTVGLSIREIFMEFVTEGLIKA